MSDTPIYDELKARFLGSESDEAEDSQANGTDALVPSANAWTVPAGAVRNGSAS